MAAQPKWKKEVDPDHFEAAKSYLSLIYSPRKSAQLVARLRRARPARFKAKDIFRASQLSRLGVSNQRVARDRKKIKEGTPLSPILLVRDERQGKVVVADGYHRLCAVYKVSEDAWIPCRII
jgi:disulfide oxidoreductase YuzD